MYWRESYWSEESSRCLAATLVQHYRAGAQREWPLLFQSTLKKSILDWQYSAARSRRWLWPLIGNAFTESTGAQNGDRRDLQDTDASGENAALLLPVATDLEVVLLAIERLPPRRQEIFLLQAWEGMNEAEIARVLRCSEGSVKANYWRALQALRMAWQQRSRSGV